MKGLVNWITFFLRKDRLDRHEVQDLSVGVRVEHEVDDVDDVSRVEHARVVGNLLQDLRGGIAVNDDARNMLLLFHQIPNAR